MHRFFLEENLKERMVIRGGDARHIALVLRMGISQELQVVTDEGKVCLAVIEGIAGETVTVRCLKVLEEPHESAVRVTLAQGLAKGEKMDFIVQKAVELGAAGVIPLAMEHCVVQLTDERARKKEERWQKIALGAARQAKRDVVPKVGAVQTLEQALSDSEGAYDLLLLAYECETEVSLKAVLRSTQAERILLIIGPEGGISPAEVRLAVSKGAKTVSLGHRILRAETAGLVALSGIFYEKDSI